MIEVALSLAVEGQPTFLYKLSGNFAGGPNNNISSERIECLGGNNVFSF